MIPWAYLSNDDLAAVRDELSSFGLLSSIGPSPVQVRRLESIPMEAHSHAAFAAEMRLWGAWEGKFAVCISAALARALGAQMWGLPADGISDEMSLDAVRELVNIMAGSVKALLPQPTDMSIPENIVADWEELGRAAAALGAVVYYSADTSYLLIALTPGPP
jgi:chemotaxis protein CheY-P-specific phosphatase CheC